MRLAGKLRRLEPVGQRLKSRSGARRGHPSALAALAASVAAVGLLASAPHRRRLRAATPTKGNLPDIGRPLRGRWREPARRAARGHLRPLLEGREGVAFMISESGMLDRFEQVRRQHDGDWLVTCPAHADRTPSLHMTLTGDRWLLDCKAGCAKADVLAAAALDWSDLFAENGNGRRDIVATYDYTDEGGDRSTRSSASTRRTSASASRTGGAGTGSQRGAPSPLPAAAGARRR